MRLAEGKLDRLPGLAEAVVREGATVILAYGEEAGRAAQVATKTLPIVCVGDDLVDSGLAASLARPGSNMTGVSILAGNPRNRIEGESPLQGKGHTA
jgi:putative tryptophan/tyrosine transport system substrate-binding protein